MMASALFTRVRFEIFYSFYPFSDAFFFCFPLYQKSGGQKSDWQRFQEQTVKLCILNKENLKMHVQDLGAATDLIKFDWVGCIPGRGFWLKKSTSKEV